MEEPRLFYLYISVEEQTFTLYWHNIHRHITNVFNAEYWQIPIKLYRYIPKGSTIVIFNYRKLKNKELSNWGILYCEIRQILFKTLLEKYSELGQYNIQLPNKELISGNGKTVYKNTRNLNEPLSVSPVPPLVESIIFSTSFELEDLYSYTNLKVPVDVLAIAEHLISYEYFMGETDIIASEIDIFNILKVHIPFAHFLKKSLMLSECSFDEPELDYSMNKLLDYAMIKSPHAIPPIDIKLNIFRAKKDAPGWYENGEIQGKKMKRTFIKDLEAVFTASIRFEILQTYLAALHNILRTYQAKAESDVPRSITAYFYIDIDSNGELEFQFLITNEVLYKTSLNHVQKLTQTRKPR